ncbi:MAG: tetratricopeptide repeat protein [Coriobacteriia bacterium]|nr:tetratricopeptide repeat protein [Coriobacteriia bacterium]
MARIASWLTYAIIFVVVSALSAVIYFLVTGILNPAGPRTEIEARLAVLENAIEENPGSGRVWADWIMYNTRAERHAEAERGWNDSRIVLADLPEQMIQADLAWAQALLLREEYEAAIEQAEVVVANDPEALAELERQNPVAATTGIVETQMLGPAHAVRGNAATALEQWDLAVEAYSSVLEISPRDSNILVARGVAYRALGDDDLARADFEEALRFMPDHSAAREFLEQMGDAR